MDNVDLENAFYIVALVYMGLMFVLFIVLLAAVLVIKSKINKLHDAIDEKVALARSIATKASIGINTVRHFVKNK
jgi:Na+/H+-dicarboxylate symporter